jgi:hypothetical protein
MSWHGNGKATGYHDTNNNSSTNTKSLGDESLEDYGPGTKWYEENERKKAAVHEKEAAAAKAAA